MSFTVFDTQYDIDNILVVTIQILTSSPRRSLSVAPVASRADEECIDNTVDAVELEGDDDAMFPMAVSNQSNKLNCSRIVTRDETSTIRVMQCPMPINIESFSK